jgi:hypothetical protein
MKCMGNCGAETGELLKKGFQIINSNSKDAFAKAILEEFRDEFLGIGVICDSCLTKLAKQEKYRIRAISSPLNKNKVKIESEGD